MRVYTLNPGNVWNPLKRHRNLPCPCGSGKKVKRCHGISEWLTKQDAEGAMKYLRDLSALGFIEARPCEISEKRSEQKDTKDV